MKFVPFRTSDHGYGTRLDASDQAIRGLDWVDSVGVMHRDIKPTNILVSFCPEAATKIADFGHAIVADQSEEDQKGTVRCHTPEIRALEEGRENAPPYDKRADICSLAYILFDHHHGNNKERENTDLALEMFHELVLKRLRQWRLSIDEPIERMFVWDTSQRAPLRDIAAWTGWPGNGTRQQDLYTEAKRRDLPAADADIRALSGKRRAPPMSTFD
ncbi:uncharacterized protein Z520_03647 [Fonsecaea multimorphosa CBS 102226]|uniref:Protein kinase domain-containing protein n=1 Tax=Fonsecaea multimorphosa CBS 102226 TaxID=1442371 RepID=A0A0D2HGH1_9EURO|nr:uncharacterized protein Z520_03647 [Fonsecaea multimorphosa CBS 102226]KIY00981.1 hypothetical protein Z520_03647 [Fonsecaea multimorphosa CBS 102226]OAL27566.1 hypothetical protein AYO22_03470 [Fonsecaea multimorphosa]